MKTKISKLRFKEFTDEWQEKKLGDVLSCVVDNRGKTPETSSSGIPLIEVNAMGTKKINYDVISKFVDDPTFKKWFRKHITNGDILFSTVGKTAMCSLYDGSRKAAIAQNIVGLRVDSSNSTDFLYYLLIQPQNNHKFKKIEMIAVQPSVKVSQMVHLKFSLPKKEEQEKIAKFLTAVDEKITKLEEKKKGFEKYKKGATQTIFSQKNRFKKENGENYLDWEEKKLGEVAFFYKGSGISKEETSDRGEVECIRYGELYTIYNEIIQNIKSRTNLNRNNLVLSQVNDVIIPSSGETSIDIATASCVLKNGVALGGDLNIIRAKANGVFLSYYLNNCKKFAKLAQGNSVVHLYSSQLKKLVMNLPDTKEQDKIAEFLTALDNKINLINNQLEQVKLFKKSLLQQMFV